jgi:ParB-like chromosome segregation protein Spo0J
MATIKRSEIKAAEYNPRKIGDAERSRLRKGIKKLGLLGPIIWNRRTGILVSGHQRLGIMDKLTPPEDRIDDGKDYMIQVAAVDMNEIEEKAANLLLNNPKAQGEFTLEGLQPLLASPGLDFEAAGFDAADAFRYGGGSLDETIASIPDDAQDAGTEDGPLDKTAATKAKESLTKLRDAMVKFDESKKRDRERESPDFYFLTVFRSTAERDAWLSHLGLDLNRFQSAVELNRALRAHGVPADADDDQASDAITSGSENAE